MRSIGIISLAFLVILCLYLAKWQIERGNEKNLLYTLSKEYFLATTGN